MKKICFIILCSLFFNFSLKAQNSFFEKVADMPGVTSVSISPKMFELMKGNTGLDSEKLHIDNITEKLTSMQILSAEDKSAIDVLRKETAHINSKNGYEELLRVKDDDEKVFIYSKNIKKDENEYVLLVDEKEEFTVVMFSGNLTIDELKSIMNN